MFLACFQNCSLVLFVTFSLAPFWYFFLPTFFSQLSSSYKERTAGPHDSQEEGEEVQVEIREDSKTVVDWINCAIWGP